MRGGTSTKKSTVCCWGYHPSLFSGSAAAGQDNFPIVPHVAPIWQAPPELRIAGGGGGMAWHELFGGKASSIDFNIARLKLVYLLN